MLKLIKLIMGGENFKVDKLLKLKIKYLVIFWGVVTAFSGRLPCIFLSVPDYVVQDG